MLGAVARPNRTINMAPPEDLDSSSSPVFYGRLDVTICRCEKAEGSYINYVFEAFLDEQKWLVKRRFTAFEKLHEALSKRFKRIKKSLPELPKTAWYRKTDADYVKKKGYRLEGYLKSLLNIPEVANSPEVYNFFFKARFAVGMRASFSGTPEAKTLSASMVNCTPESDAAFNDKSNVQNTKLSPTPSASTTQTVGPDEDGAEIFAQLNPGTPEYEWLVRIDASIKAKRQELAALEEERKHKLACLVKDGNLIGIEPGKNSELEFALSQSLHSVEEESVDVTDALMQQQLRIAQQLDCSWYGSAAAVEQAIKVGVLIVVFPQVGTEVAVQLQDAGASMSTLTGQTVLNGLAMRFEGRLDSPNLTSGTGCLIAVGA